MKIKPILIGAGIGLLVGLLMLGSLAVFGLFPLLSVLNLPAIYLVMSLFGGSLGLTPYAMVAQWILVGTMAGACLQGWREPAIRRRLLAGLGASVIAWVTLAWISGREPKDKLTVSEGVYQGVVPGQGSVIFGFQPLDKSEVAVFYQQTGEYRCLRCRFQNGVVTAALVDDGIKPTTNGWLTFQWASPSTPMIQGTWQPASRGTAQSVKFQRVATMWQREHTFNAFDGLNVRVRETRDFPVFSKGWQMDEITQTLDRTWWAKDTKHPESRFQRVTDWMESWFAGHAEEAVEAYREMGILFVSDPLVCVSTQSTYDQYRTDKAKEHLTWNFVKEGSHYRQFELAEVFQRGTPWAERLAAISREHFGSAVPEWVNLKQLTATDFKQFAVLPAGLLIRFEPFASPSEGLPQLLIPWPKLRDIVDDSGPAKTLWREKTIKTVAGKPTLIIHEQRNK